MLCLDSFTISRLPDIAGVSGSVRFIMELHLNLSVEVVHPHDEFGVLVWNRFPPVPYPLDDDAMVGCNTVEGQRNYIHDVVDTTAWTSDGPWRLHRSFSSHDGSVLSVFSDTISDKAIPHHNALPISIDNMLVEVCTWWMFVNSISSMCFLDLGLHYGGVQLINILNLCCSGSLLRDNMAPQFCCTSSWVFWSWVVALDRRLMGDYADTPFL